MGAVDIYQAAFYIWNQCLALASTTLQKNPLDGKVKGLTDVLKIIENINVAFVAIGSSLVVLFFIINFCAQTTDIKDEVRLETIIKSFVTLIITDYFVVNSYTIVKDIFSLIISWVTKVFESAGGSVETYKIPTNVADNKLLSAVDDLGFLTGLVAAILGILFLLVVLGIGFFIISIVYTRVFKLFIYIPLAPLALSTIAGGRLTNFSATSYLKSLIGILSEAIVISIALILSTGIKAGTILTFTSEFSGLAYVVASTSEYILAFVIILGICGQAGQIVHKAFGL